MKYVPGISFRTDNEPFKVCLSLSHTHGHTLKKGIAFMANVQVEKFTAYMFINVVYFLSTLPSLDLTCGTLDMMLLLVQVEN